MKAKEYLKIYLGGNMFVKTLTPHAIATFAEDYHNYKIRMEKDKIIDIKNQNHEHTKTNLLANS